MIQLEQVGDRAESLLEVCNLLERIAKLDHGRLVEHALLAHHEFAVFEAVEVRGDEEEIRAGFDLSTGDTTGLFEGL